MRKVFVQSRVHLLLQHCILMSTVPDTRLAHSGSFSNKHAQG
jgi:hypothetical protein